MGLKYSSPLTNRRKSKVSLTWILHDQDKIPRERRFFYEDLKIESDLNKHKKCDVKNMCETSSSVQNAVSNRIDLYDIIVSHDENSETRKRRRHRHRARRESRRSRNYDDFGYDIDDVDFFLTKGTLDNPANIPVVVICQSTLYKTRQNRQEEQDLPLGTVVNAVFKKRQWVYVQTPHGEEGYLLYTYCVPLGILPECKRSNNSYNSVPCWESSTDIYPPPIGNTINNTNNNRQTKSESNYVVKTDYSLYSKPTKSLCNEEIIDNLYMTVTRKPNVEDRTFKERHILLVIHNDFNSIDYNTLTVCKGDVVLLIQGAGMEPNVDAEWYYVRREDGLEGFIPSHVAGHGYI